MTNSMIPSGADRQHGATVPVKPADVPASGSQSTVMATNGGSQPCDNKPNAPTASESAGPPSGAQNNPDDDAHREGEGASGDSQQLQHRAHHGGVRPKQFNNSQWYAFHIMTV